MRAGSSDSADDTKGVVLDSAPSLLGRPGTGSERYPRVDLIQAELRNGGPPLFEHGTVMEDVLLVGELRATVGTRLYLGVRRWTARAVDDDRSVDDLALLLIEGSGQQLAMQMVTLCALNHPHAPTVSVVVLDYIAELGEPVEVSNSDVALLLKAIRESVEFGYAVVLHDRPI